MTDYLIYSFYQNGMFSVEDNLFYEDKKRLGYSEDEKDGSIVSNNHREVVNRLSELKELNIELKRENKTFRRENEQLKRRINSRLHYYRELYNHFDKNDGFSYNIVEKVIEDLEDILR